MNYWFKNSIQSVYMEWYFKCTIYKLYNPFQSVVMYCNSLLLKSSVQVQVLNLVTVA